MSCNPSLAPADGDVADGLPGAGAARGPAGPQGAWALVADDNRLNSRLLEILLGRLGLQVRSVESGRLALALLAEQTFDLVVLDLRMADVGGEQVCRAIREQRRLQQLPVVAYTAHCMPEERGRILAIGFNGLLIKPVSFADVKSLCSDMLGWTP